MSFVIQRKIVKTISLHFSFLCGDKKFKQQKKDGDIALYEGNSLKDLCRKVEQQL